MASKVPASPLLAPTNTDSAADGLRRRKSSPVADAAAANTSPPTPPPAADNGECRDVCHQKPVLDADGDVATTAPDADAACVRMLPDDYIKFKDGSWVYCMRRPFWLNAVLCVLLIGCGILEGVAFQRSGIVDPESIYGQMVFKVWIVMKMFLSAVGASMIAQALLDLLVPSFFVETRATRYSKNGYVRPSIGGAMLGVGMSLAGTGPTMLPAMIGAGVGNAWITALGFLGGGVAFAVLDELWLHKFRYSVDEAHDIMVADEQLGVRYWKLALPLGALLLGFACVLEFVLVTKEDDQRKLNVGKLLWPAVSVGVIIGLNQIIMRFIAHHGQGGSSGVMVVVSLLTWGKLAPSSFPTGFTKLFQLLFVWGGTLVGSYLSAYASRGETHGAPGMNAWRSAVGGFLAILGSRIAGGCTCGAGVTGSSEFGKEAVITTVAIFAGGIATGFIIQAAS